MNQGPTAQPEGIPIKKPRLELLIDDVFEKVTRVPCQEPAWCLKAISVFSQTNGGSSKKYTPASLHENKMAVVCLHSLVT